MTLKHTFYKENGIWYIDLPEFLNAGLGTKANLMMVAGADTFLDKISNNGDYVEVEINTNVDSWEIGNFDYELMKTNYGMDKELLDKVGHAPVEYGAYYNVTDIDHRLWLCPVTEYVFGGSYPDMIYINILSTERSKTKKTKKNMDVLSFLRRKISIKPLIMFAVAALTTVVYPLTELLMFKQGDTMTNAFLIGLLTVGIITMPIALVVLLTGISK